MCYGKKKRERDREREREREKTEPLNQDIVPNDKGERYGS